MTEKQRQVSVKTNTQADKTSDTAGTGLAGKAQQHCAHVSSSISCCEVKSSISKGLGCWRMCPREATAERKQLLDQPLISVIAAHIPVKATNRKSVWSARKKANYQYNMLFRENKTKKQIHRTHTEHCRNRCIKSETTLVPL